MLDPASDLGDRALGSRSYAELYYAEHYVEYAPAARRLALTMVPPDVADDIVAEAFARVLAAIRAGGGPSHAFRAYLLTAVRNLACDWQRARGRLTVVGDMDVQADDEPAGPARVNPGIGCAAETQAEARDEVRLVTRAFGRLPARWRAVLWQLEVEGKAPAAVAPMFGLSANGVSALAMRAREGLRQAYLAEHVGSNIPVECRTYAAEFGAGARGRLSQRRRAAMQEHLSHCPACQDLFTELTELNSRLGTILTPAALAAASSALGSAKRTAILRTTLAGHWRTWRWHPVTTVTGAAAGVAVAGGMLLAVNVTPVTIAPAHAAVQPAASAAAPSGPVVRKRQPGGGAGGSAASTAARPGPAAPAGPGSSAGASSLTAAILPPGATVAALPDGPAIGAPAVGPTPTSQAPSSAGTATTSASGNLTQTVATTAGATVTSLTNTASGAVTGLAKTTGAAVTGVTNSTSGLVSTATKGVTGVTGTAVNAVTGVTGTATNAVTGAASTAANAVTGAASTANVTVTTAGSTASNVASQAASTATATAASTADAAANTVGTATAAVTGLASAAASSL